MAKCFECGTEFETTHYGSKWCSTKCKSRHRKKHGGGTLSAGHYCRMCGKHFSLFPGQGNKWLCSPECRKARNAQSVRTFHTRRPEMEAIYRKRTREKMLPDSQHYRFYKLNPDAPHACESCGEIRVLEIAHRPGFERIGERRSNKNLVWPEQTWVLCPTCHRLIDRMNYSPDELGLRP